jgi:hypothetical protein
VGSNLTENRAVSETHLGQKVLHVTEAFCSSQATTRRGSVLSLKPLSEISRSLKEFDFQAELKI